MDCLLSLSYLIRFKDRLNAGQNAVISSVISAPPPVMFTVHTPLLINVRVLFLQLCLTHFNDSFFCAGIYSIQSAVSRCAGVRRLPCLRSETAHCSLLIFASLEAGKEIVLKLYNLAAIIITRVNTRPVELSTKILQCPENACN